MADIGCSHTSMAGCPVPPSVPGESSSAEYSESVEEFAPLEDVGGGVELTHFSSEITQFAQLLLIGRRLPHVTHFIQKFVRQIMEPQNIGVRFIQGPAVPGKTKNTAPVRRELYRLRPWKTTGRPAHRNVVGEKKPPPSIFNAHRKMSLMHKTVPGNAAVYGPSNPPAAVCTPLKARHCYQQPAATLCNQ